MKKTILLMVILLCVAVPVMADTGETKGLMEMLNLNWEQFIELSAAVALVTEAFKRRLSGVFKGGWKTHVLTATVGLALSMFSAWGDVATIATMAVGLYLFPMAAVGTGKSLLEVSGIIPPKKGVMDDSSNAKPATGYGTPK